MITPSSSQSELERRAREVFDASVEGLDARTRSRLNQARRAAAAELERSPHRPRWVMWAPAGALAAAALIAVLLLPRSPGTGNGEAPRTQVADAAAVPVEVLVADDDLAIAKEDLDFYEWVGYQTNETSAPANDIG